MAVTWRRGALGRDAKMRRRIVAMADQGVSSLSNIVVTILVARSFDTTAFGAFGFALVAYTLALGGIRALVGESLLSLYSHEGPSTRRRLVADFLGATVFLGTVASLLLAVIAVVTGGLIGSGLLALACVLPLVLLQDSWRYLFIIDRPAAALAIDLIWLVTVVVALPLAPTDAGVAWYVVAWGLGGGLGAIAGTVLGWGLPARPHPWRWLVDHRATGPRFFGEFLTARGVAQLVQVLLSAVAGVAALGAFRAALVFYGPLNTLHSGIYLVAVPEGAQSRDDPRRLRRMFVIVALCMATVSVAWMLVGLLLPDSWGQTLFGATWGEARDLMVPTGLMMIAAAGFQGALLGLRSLADAERSLRCRLYTAPWHLAFTMTGAQVGGAVGFAFGFACAEATAALIWWRGFGRSLRDFERRQAAGGTRTANGTTTGEVPAVEDDGDLPVPTLVADLAGGDGAYIETGGR